MQMLDSVKRLLAETMIFVHPEEYTIVSIPKSEEFEARRILCGLEHFSSVTFDIGEISVVLKKEDWRKIKGYFVGFMEEGPYRLITFDIVLDLSVVGFLAVVSKRLAEAGISIYALSTFLRDHILVKIENADRATETLQRLIDDCKRI